MDLECAVGVFLVAVIVLVVGVGAFVLVKRKEEEENGRRGPPSWPLVGAVFTHAANLPCFHDYVTHYCRLYTTFNVPYPSFNYYYTVLPANVEYVLKANFHNYVKGRFMYDKQKEFLGDGIFSVDGTEWKQQRKTASYEFASRTLREFSEVAFREKAIILAIFLISECKDRKSVDMQDVLLRLTFDSFSKVGFGVEMSTLQKEPPPEQLAFVNAFDETNALIFMRYVDPLWRLKRWLKVGREARLAKVVSKLDGIVLTCIQQRREMHQGSKAILKPDLLSRFLDLSKENPQEFTNRKIRDIMLNFMIAGRDTTALALCWFLYAISNKPSLEEKLVNELYQIEGLKSRGAATCGGRYPSEEEIWRFANLLTYEKLAGLHYLHACLQETLRLYPPVPEDVKVAVASDMLPDGTKVKKGDCIGISPYAMGRMEWLWGDDALEFKPERFLQGGVCRQESPFKLTAFMAGPRMCLGKDFAMLQMKVIAAILLRFFKFEVVPGHNVRYRIMMTLHMSEEGLRMNILPRV